MVYCFTLFSFLMVVIKYLYYKVNCSADVKRETDYTIVPLILSSPNTFLIFITQQRHIDAICSVITSNSAIKPLFCFISILNSAPPNTVGLNTAFWLVGERGAVGGSLFLGFGICYFTCHWNSYSCHHLAAAAYDGIYLDRELKAMSNAVVWSFVITFESKMCCKKILDVSS